MAFHVGRGFFRGGATGDQGDQMQSGRQTIGASSEVVGVNHADVRKRSLRRLPPEASHLRLNFTSFRDFA